MKSRCDFSSVKRVVIKIGSSLLTNHGQGLNREAIASWVKQVVALKTDSVEVILVSSGSVAEGMCRLGWHTRPQTLHELQAAAAIGQMGLVQVYENFFQQHGMHTAQVLLTHDDLSDRRRYLNAKSTLLTLLSLNVVPIINENDVVATDEIRFGDNDNLGALVANLTQSELLIILTDQQGLYSKNPALYQEAKIISQINVNDSSLEAMAGDSLSGLGRGGMTTKINAARLAARSGSATVIAGGFMDNVIIKIIEGQQIGSFLVPNVPPLVARKQWLAGHLQTKGQLVLDEGAVKVLRTAGKSLLSIGVVSSSGYFGRGDLVVCVDGSSREVARGLVNYGNDEVNLIQGRASADIKDLLGYVNEPELIHRDNLMVL